MHRRFGVAAAGMLVAGALLASAGVLAQAPAAQGDRVKAMFDRVDADRDGFVTKAEADTARARIRTQMETRNKERRDRAFARLDTNSDGTISRAEFDAAPRMARMDGPRGRRDMRRAQGEGLAAGRAFERLDTDRDGRVSLAEAQAGADRRLAMRGGRHSRAAQPMLPPGHPPVPGQVPMSDGDRPLGGGRN